MTNLVTYSNTWQMLKRSDKHLLAHLEKFSLNLPSLSFKPSLFFYGLILSLLGFSILVYWQFQVSNQFKSKFVRGRNISKYLDWVPLIVQCVKSFSAWHKIQSYLGMFQRPFHRLFELLLNDSVPSNVIPTNLKHINIHSTLSPVGHWLCCDLLRRENKHQFVFDTN